MDNKKTIKLLMECVNIASKQYPAMAEQYMEAFHVADAAVKNNCHVLHGVAYINGEMVFGTEGDRK